MKEIKKIYFFSMAEVSRGPESDQFVQHDSKFVRKKIVSKSKSKKKVEIKEEQGGFLSV